MLPNTCCVIAQRQDVTNTCSVRMQRGSLVCACCKGVHCLTVHHPTYIFDLRRHGIPLQYPWTTYGVFKAMDTFTSEDAVESFNYCSCQLGDCKSS